jgi:hypothetical protein
MVEELLVHGLRFLNEAARRCLTRVARSSRSSPELVTDLTSRQERPGSRPASRRPLSERGAQTLSHQANSSGLVRWSEMT